MKLQESWAQRRLYIIVVIIRRSIFWEGWAERVAEFINRFLEGRSDIEVALENVLDPKWEPLKAVADQVEADKFWLVPGYRTC